MKPFFASLRPHEVHHLRNLLQSAGIACRLHNEHLATLAGEVPFTECAAQLVLDRDEDHALAEMILRDWRESARHRQPPWTCTRCGEWIEGQFTACWRCAAEEPRET